jgi:hypothetical protein
MADLSPAAREVMDAFLGDAEDTGLQMDDLRGNIAAALRAAADQGENLYDPHEGKVPVVRVEQLLAIAAELEGQ